MQKLKASLLFLVLFLPSLSSHGAKSADMKKAARSVPFCLPLTNEYDLGAALKSLASDQITSYPPELNVCIKKMDAGKASISSQTLKPLMPYIIRFVASQFVETIGDTEATRAPRVKDGCQESINIDVIKPVTNNNVSTGIIVSLLCELQKDIDRKFKFLFKKIENIEEELDEIFDTLTECCQDLSSQVEGVSGELDECCSEILNTLSICFAPTAAVEEAPSQPVEA